MSRKISSDPEKVIAWLDKGDEWMKQGRALFLEGYTQQDQIATPPNISGIKFFIKGGTKAGPNDSFAFCFGSNQDGSVPAEKRALVEYLKTNKELKAGEYTVTISKDFKFIQRKREVKVNAAKP